MVFLPALFIGASAFVLRGGVRPAAHQEQRGGQWRRQRLYTIAACDSPTADGGGKLNLLYDSKCAVCQWEVDNLRSLGCGESIQFTDLEDTQYDPQQNGDVGYREAMERITAVTADGEVVQGLEVFARCYDVVGLGWLFGVTRLPVVGALLERAYEAFAVVRTLLTRGRSIDALVKERQEREAAGGRQPSVAAPSPPGGKTRSPPDVRMMAAHSPEDVQTAAALVLPLLAYKASAIVQRVQLQWYLDATIALTAAALIVYASS